MVSLAAFLIGVEALEGQGHLFPPLCFPLWEITGMRLDPNNGHHAVVLMPEDVAMIDEVAYIRPAEVHANFDAWVEPRPGPEGNLDHIEELPILRVHRRAVLFQEQEMNLMEVEFMIFQGPVLDGPVLRRSLRGDDGRRIVGIEKHRSCSVNGDEKVRGAERVVRV